MSINYNDINQTSFSSFTMKTKVTSTPKATKQRGQVMKMTMKRSQTILVTVPAVTLKIGQKFKPFKAIAAQFGAKSNPFHTFAYIGKTASNADVAIWGVNLDPKSPWNNRFTNDGNTLLESKAYGESRDEFLKRIRKNLDYDAEQLRLTFARIKNVYYFVGFYQLSSIDVDNQTIIYKKVADELQSVFYKRLTKKLAVTIEESLESTEGVIFG